MKPVLAILALFFSLCFSLAAQADELRPAYLQITELQPERYQVTWKVPAAGSGAFVARQRQPGLDLQFDDSVKPVTAVQSGYVDGTALHQWQVSRDGGLGGAGIKIDGLAMQNTEVLLRLENLDGTSILHRLTPDSSSYIVAEKPSLGQVIWSYLVLGVEHILVGLDHLLFVLALMLLVKGTRNLIATITAFTIAHSITLSLAALDVIRVPVPPVEAIIALSIIFVATEIIRNQNGEPGLTQGRPWIVAFTFGLLHGLGFAAVLGEIGMPTSAVPAALLFFNLGVELGQLLFVAFVLLCARMVGKLTAVPVWWQRIPPYVIGSVASFWMIERVAGF